MFGSVLFVPSAVFVHYLNELVNCGTPVCLK